VAWLVEAVRHACLGYPARVSQNISLSSSGPPETVLPPESAEIRHVADQILNSLDVSHEKLGEAEDLARRSPRSLLAWSLVGQTSPTTIGSYAAFRVGYHRGLDALRANGWRGSGFVRWTEPGNLGFLRCLLGLAIRAGEIGESDEAVRCEQFLLQLDPRGVPAEERTRIAQSLRDE